MGDIFGYDEHTSALLETLERLNLYNSLLDGLEKAAGIALNNFGTPTQLYMSPQHYKSMIYGSFAGAPTQESVGREIQRRGINWDTRDILPAGMDHRDLRGIISNSNYSKFMFMETLRKLDLGPHIASWYAYAEL